MNFAIRKRAWKEMKSTFQSYDSKNKINLILIVLFFTTVPLLEFFRSPSGDKIVRWILITSLILIATLYGVCFDTLKRFLQERDDTNQSGKEKNQNLAERSKIEQPEGQPSERGLR